jgi:hypothetical protein
MACRHDGFREIRSDYDASAGVLVYHWTCERCSTRIAEAWRTVYRPAFDPRGNDQYLEAGGETPVA